MTREPASDPGEGDDLARRCEAVWGRIAPRMAALPIYNPALDVQTTSFRRHGLWTAGIVVTPWFMNVVARHDGGLDALQSGARVTVDLPVGSVEATVADIEGIGRIAVASLFSPMDGFADPSGTRHVAEAALEALFGRGEERRAPRATTIDRRGLLLGRLNREACA